VEAIKERIDTVEDKVSILANKVDIIEEKLDLLRQVLLNNTDLAGEHIDTSSWWLIF